MKSGKKIASLMGIGIERYFYNSSLYNNGVSERLYTMKVFPLKISLLNEEYIIPKNYHEYNPYLPTVDLNIKFLADINLSTPREKWHARSNKVINIINNYMNGNEISPRINEKFKDTTNSEKIHTLIKNNINNSLKKLGHKNVTYKIYPYELLFEDAQELIIDKNTNGEYIKPDYTKWLSENEDQIYINWVNNRVTNNKYKDEPNHFLIDSNIETNSKNNIFSEKSLIEQLYNGSIRFGSNKTYDGVNTLVNYAIVKNYSTLLDLLIKKGAKGIYLNKYNTLGQAPIHNAIIYERINMLQKLIDAGADIENWDKKYGETPLMAATRYNQYKYVNLLLNKGADVNGINTKGLTALEKELRFHKKFKKELPLYAILELIRKGAKVPSEYEYILNQYDLYKDLVHKK